MSTPDPPLDPTEAAMRLAAGLDARGIAYAIGGALAFDFCRFRAGASAAKGPGKAAVR